MAISERVMEIPAESLQAVFGAYDSYIKIIEKNLQVTVIERGNEEPENWWRIKEFKIEF